MSEIAIRVEHLSKRYRIGLEEERPDTFAGALTSFVRSPLKNFRQLRRLSRLEEGEAEDIIWALKDVSFEVKRGEVIGIIGRNGAGKSTLLKILSRITEPTSGRVEMYGRVSSLLEVGTGFHPELTGRENIYLNGTILGMRKAEIDRKFDEIVDFSGVEKFIDTPVKRYSSGMKVRLAFSVAAHLEPEILLVDEILAVGDVEFQRKCLGKMGEVAKGGRTVLFVSHNMLAIQKLCHNAVWLNNGSIISKGKVKQVVHEYLKATSNLSKIPLMKRRDRGGDGRLRFCQISVLDENKEPVSAVKSGSGITLRIDFKLTQELVLKDVFFQISFLNALGQQLFVLATRFSNGNFKEVKQGDYVLCKIPVLPLLPGVYELHLFAKEGYELLDAIFGAAQINVIPDDVFGSGKLQPSDGGSIIVPHEWEIFPQEIV